MSDSINSNNKKYYDKYVVDNTSDLGPGRVEPAPGGKQVYGAEKYAVRGNYKPINCDPTRFTENDMGAHNKINMGGENEVDDSEGGKY
jgi:hypothetical protein